MRQLNIDGVKNDVRVLCTGPNDSEDAGLVNGVPIDPPDWTAGWVLVDLWVEHDTVQEKADKGQVTTRKVNPTFYQLWVRPKSKAKKKAVVKPPEQPKPPAEAKRRGRRPRNTPPEPPQLPPEEKQDGETERVIDSVS